MPEKTVFQKILDKEIPAFELFRGAGIVAFLDRNQATRGHSLIISEAPDAHWADVDPIQFLRGQHLSQILAKRMMTVLDPQPQRILRGTFGYDVPHWHDHLIPSYERTDTQNIYTKKTPVSNEELAEVQHILAFSTEETAHITKQLLTMGAKTQPKHLGTR